ncbi:MAG TPA: sigma-70 family RNA polymerase sigma factor [Phenylobacterium sp.]
MEASGEIVAPQSASELPDEAEQLLWRAARDDHDAGARESLFTKYLPFARQVARRHHRAGGLDIDLDDLGQLACTGLLEALDRYDFTRGVPFKAYAGRRISGSILNGISKLSEVREQISFRNRVRTERLRSLSVREESDADASDPLRALAELAVGLAIGFMLEGSGLVVGKEDVDPRPSAYDSLVWKDALRRVRGLIDDLPDRQRAIIRQHYFQGVPFEEIATLLGLSKGRVSQLHRGAIDRVREALQRAPNFEVRR